MAHHKVISKIDNEINNQFDEKTFKNNCKYYKTISDLNFIHQNNITNNENIFNLINLNVRSLVKKSDKLHQFVKDCNLNFKIIAITETWLNNDTEQIAYIDGYTFKGKHRNQKREVM